MTKGRGPGRVVLLVLDSVGIGALPDADRYGDEGSNTLANTARAVGGLSLPNLARLGLGRIIPVQGVPALNSSVVRGSWGRMAIRSPGKDTMTGHWEMMGIVLDRPFRTYPEGFPPEVIRAFTEQIGRPVLGNVPASGTEIIARLGQEHLETGWPIVYTSADSVFQIAAHEDIVPVEELYGMCLVARRLLVGDHQVGRVIARPFTGGPGSFVRTDRRRDFPLSPPAPTVLDVLQREGYAVMAVGKVRDIFDGRGVSHWFESHDNRQGIEGVTRFLDDGRPGLIFANLVDFDMIYGHRNDVEGYARALAEADALLPSVLDRLQSGDRLLVCADHGCDPTTESTDHSREYVPLLVTGPAVRAGRDLGTRNTLADIGATLCEWFAVRWEGPGTSFAAVLQPDGPGRRGGCS